ncbi:MAG: electron transport complex subunit RsxC [Gammaproteobacteria bacterium]|nr:electron transport complex subunit RsxC [Gammaproteobacteria bacterium]MCP5195693.1 electron transport complex subunit RsxC [Gammaproteobacteria bacterium]
MSRLFPFHGGLKTVRHKTESNRQPIQPGPLPRRLTVPLRQHIGAIAKALVQVGDSVLKGQMIGQADGYISAAVHAPTSGVVVAVDTRPVPHPSGLPDLCVVIDSDGENRWIERQPVVYRALHPSELRNILRNAGIVGLGGAAFPSAVKLNLSGQDQHLETLILNGAECEPWITCDDRLMRERAAGIIAGLHVMVHLLEPREVLIGIEDDKPEAIAAMSEMCAGTGYAVRSVPTRYPSGSVKQLVKLLTGKETPVEGLPIDVGVQCFNVATAYTIHRAIDHGEPVISRVVTVTGHVSRPGNLDALLGTPFAELIEQCGGYREKVERLIMGGPMMGFALHSDEVPLTKAANCILAASAEELTPTRPVAPCIRCGACVEVCPANLLPQQLYWHARAKEFDKAQDYHLFSCIECGCCSAVCPSHIPLVQYYRYAKNEIWAQEKEKQKAELARQRHQARLERLEREKQEREAKLRQKSPARTAKAEDSGAGGKLDIQTAVAQAKPQPLSLIPSHEGTGESEGEKTDQSLGKQDV